MSSPLDDPFFSALTTDLKGFAEGDHLAIRFRPEVAPFGGFRDLSALARLIPRGESVGVMNWNDAPGWEVLKQFEAVQMILDHRVEAETSQVIDLDQADLPQMLALTKLVYPAYFREETTQLGRYVGVKHGDDLIAMAGLRLSIPGYHELSAICTHPSARRQGLARQMIARLCEIVMEEGRTPFLHTEADNHSGQALYRSMGFVERARLIYSQVRKSDEIP